MRWSRATAPRAAHGTACGEDGYTGHRLAHPVVWTVPYAHFFWAGEPQDALSLYLHVPFCEVRCGFCNLFTRVGAPDGLCDIAEGMGADLRAIPLSVEASPATATADRLAVLAGRGITGLSLGVQSFDDTEARAAVRPQRRADVEAALGRVRDAAIAVLNIDLIYGIDGQTPQSWAASLDAALAWRPEELYLYPLYVRPLTGLARRGGDPDPELGARRLDLYRRGRDRLLAAGYVQKSMRMFRRADAPDAGPDDYACQTAA